MWRGAGTSQCAGVRDDCESSAGSRSSCRSRTDHSFGYSFRGGAPRHDYGSGQDALDSKFVDQLSYYDEVLDELKKKTGLNSDDKVKLVDLKKYAESLPAIKEYSAKKIAVIYAVVVMAVRGQQ